MPLRNRIESMIFGRLKARGPAWMVRKLWNREFAAGAWDYIDRTPGDMIYPWIERYANGGSILDLGCGSGNTGNELRADRYRLYLGIDLSDVAVEKARERSVQSGRGNKNRYVQGDICNYDPQDTFDVILFRESIWYIPRPRLRNVLDAYRRHLTPSGVLIVRIYDRFQHDHIVRTLKEHCQSLQEYAPTDAKDIVLVLR